MTQQCPTCAAASKQPPKELADLLHWLAPPPSLLTYLDDVIAKTGSPSPEFTAWRDKWAAVNAPEQVAMVDQFDNGY